MLGARPTGRGVPEKSVLNSVGSPAPRRGESFLARNEVFPDTGPVADGQRYVQGPVDSHWSLTIEAISANPAVFTSGFSLSTSNSSSH